MTDFFTSITNLAVTIIFLVLTLGAWIQHVITCILNEQWILLAFGVIVPPVGWIHGIGVWFGVF